MYGDKITDSMKEAMDETNRRRQIQMKYNTEHGIVPRTIMKPVRDIVRSKETKEMTARYLRRKKLGKKDTATYIKELEAEMKEAAGSLDFERAAELRDMIFELKAES